MRRRQLRKSASVEAQAPLDRAYVLRRDLADSQPLPNGPKVHQLTLPLWPVIDLYADQGDPHGV